MMPLNQNTNNSYTARQLKLLLEIEKLIDISDPVYTFCEVMDHIDLSRYFVEKSCRTGRTRCDEQKLLKVILFAFMEKGVCSLREIEKLCRNDIRYMYLFDEMKAPTFATFGNFIRNELTASIEQIFMDINAYIFSKHHVDLQYIYIDGTKMEANANRYTWVWKMSYIKNRQKTFDKISILIDALNQEVLGYLGLKLEKREEYTIDYVFELLEMYKKGTGLDENLVVFGCGHRKSIQQKQYQELTVIHQEVLNNLESIHGALLRLNRSIQSDGTFGVLKWDKSYKRLFRRGEKNVILELTLISCGFNLYKYHNKKQRQMKAA